MLDAGGPFPQRNQRLSRGAPAQACESARNGNADRRFAAIAQEKTPALFCDRFNASRFQMADDLTRKPRQRGHSREYILGRLEREGHTDWLAAIESGRLSPYAAATELWFKRPPTLNPNSNQSKRRRFRIRALIGQAHV